MMKTVAVAAVPLLALLAALLVALAPAWATLWIGCDSRSGRGTGAVTIMEAARLVERPLIGLAAAAVSEIA